MSKVMSFIPLHYGAEYLAYSIQSVEAVVDKITILYTGHPSFGRETQELCPDTKEQLKEIAFGTSGKIEWIDVLAGNEGAHRAKVYDYSDGYDIILPIDSDEAWDPKALDDVLRQVEEGDAERYGVLGFIHFWKSFNHVCRDQFAPIRAFKPAGEGEVAVSGCIYHFGYAQRQEIMDYKWMIHGHQDELRPEWKELYLNWNGEGNVHPVAHGVWNPEPFDKTALPDFLKLHPNYGS